MPGFDSLKRHWERLSANWTPVEPGNEPYLIYYHQDVPERRNYGAVGNYNVPERPARRPITDLFPVNTHGDEEFNRASLQEHRARFNTQDRTSPDDVTHSHVRRQRTASVPVPQPDYITEPPHATNPTYSPDSASSATLPHETQSKPTMSRKSSSSSSSTKSSSNSSNHHARKALDRMRRIYATRGQDQDNEATSVAPSTSLPADTPSHANEPSTPLSAVQPIRSESDLGYHSDMSPASSPITVVRRESNPRPSPPHPSLDSLPRPSFSTQATVPVSSTPSSNLWKGMDPERRPLLPMLSPQVSPLVTNFTALHCNSDSPLSEPFPDLEHASYFSHSSNNSDASYENVGVSVRRRWDLGGGQRGWRREDRGIWAWVYAFFVFGVCVVGGGAVLIWALVHQGGWYIGGDE